MMRLPSCFLPQPVADWGADTIASFEELFARSVEPGGGTLIDYRLRAPKWQFLCYLCDRRGIVLHGSGDAGIEELEPRASNDVSAFGNRRAIYAASDGIWAIYFAIVDRQKHVTSLMNACFRVVEPEGRGEPHYFFSVNRDALPHRPWREGMVYLLPRETFEPQPLETHRGATIEIAQWASLGPVRPAAKLAVCPRDFPFLEQVHGHDPAVIGDRARADPDGFPWLDE